MVVLQKPTQLTSICTPQISLMPAQVYRSAENIPFLIFKNNMPMPHLTASVSSSNVTNSAHIISSAGRLIGSLEHCFHR